jgi:hypothetical protein
MKPTTIDGIKFAGLIGNRRLHQITTNEFMSALAKCGWREAHNAHVLMRLRERGMFWGLRTANDFARALRYGYTVSADDGAMARVCCLGQCWVIFRPELRSLITIGHAGG